MNFRSTQKAFYNVFVSANEKGSLLCNMEITGFQLYQYSDVRHKSVKKGKNRDRFPKNVVP